jgi:hypothetical protein
MNGKRWFKVWAIIIIIIPIVGGFNYLIDPYGLYNTKYFSFAKIKQSNKMMLIKALKTEEIKYTSICLGTSRTEVGYNPNHKYFIKPSYNLGVSGSSMYESRLYFENTLKKGNLEKVLLVADFIMFNANKQKSINEFETYFQNKSIYNFLFSVDTLIDSLLTIKGGSGTNYYDNGQIFHDYSQKNIDEVNGHIEVFRKNEKVYYEKNPDNYLYSDTKLNSFDDFEKIVKQSYENNIELDIIFGPSHIRQWESFNYRKSFNQWLQWKKDVVISVNKIAHQQNKKQFRIMDFSVYHNLTAEKVPTDKDTKMKYHWEASHYKNELGLVVLDRLIGDSNFNDFGIELNLQNIDEHLKQQEIKRHKFIDVDKYQIEVFGKVKQ